MADPWIIAALGAQLTFAMAVTVDKVVLDRWVDRPDLVTVGASLLNAGLAVVLLSIFGYPDLDPIRDLVLALGAGGMLFAYLVPYLRALNTDDASVIGPMFQMITPLTVLVAFFAGSAVPTGSEFVGLITVLLGTALFAVGDGYQPRLVRLRSAGLMFTASALLASQYVLLDSLLDRHALREVLPALAVGFAVVGLAYNAIFTRGWKELHGIPASGWIAIGGAEVLNVTAEVLLTVALALGPAALVASTSATEPLFLVAIGWAFTRWAPHILHERESRRGTLTKLSGSVAVGLGLAVIAA